MCSDNGLLTRCCGLILETKASIVFAYHGAYNLDQKRVSQAMETLRSSLLTKGRLSIVTSGSLGGMSLVVFCVRGRAGKVAHRADWFLGMTAKRGC